MDLPADWVRGNIRRFASMKTGHTPSRSVPAYWESGDVPWFTLADVWQLRDDRRTYLDDTSSKITVDGLANSSAELLPAGTVVLSRTASVGFSGVMPRPMATSQDFWNWVCGPRLLPEFLNYQFKAMRPQLRAFNMGSTHQTIYQRDAAAIQIVVPPLSEQRAIADYLDRETSQIDTLVEEQQRLTALLSERRDALWSNMLAATRATAVPIRRVIESIVDGPFGSSLTSAHYTDSGTRVIRLGNIGIFKFKDSDAAYIDEEYGRRLEAHSARPGDVVIAGLGDDRMPLGRAALVPDHLGPAIVKADCYRVRPNRRLIEPSYLAWALSAPPSRTQIGLLARGSTRARLNTSVVREVTIPLPPLAVQEATVIGFESQAASIDQSILENERFIELATERRSALITAAVTGQIDVGAAA